MIATTDSRPSRNSLRRQCLKMIQFIAAMTDPTNAEHTLAKLVEADPALLELLKPQVKKLQIRIS